MSRLRACYQNAVTDESLWLASLATYWELLRSYDPDSLRAAFAVAWRRCPEWFPSAGQLAALVEGEPNERAEEAWPEVLRLARRSSGEHSDPVAAEAIRRMGGGLALGRMRSDELAVWGKKEFRSLYLECIRQQQRERAQIAARDRSELATGQEKETGIIGSGSP